VLYFETVKTRWPSHTLLLSVLAAAASTALALAACVGDEPGAAPVTIVDGSETGSDGSATSEGSVADSGTDSPLGDPDTGVDSGPWSPARLDEANNLAVWLEPSAANFVTSSGTIATWKDLSKNKNDAKNTTGGPTIHAALLNGHDTVHFDQGVILTIDDAASVRFAAQQFYIAAVARLIPGTGSGFFFSKATAMASGAGSQYAAGFEFWAGPGSTDAGATAVFPLAHVSGLLNNELDWADPVFDDSKFHLVAARRINAFNLALSVDDQPDRVTSTGSFDVDEVGSGVNLGAFRYGTFRPPVDFDIAELIVVHGPTAIVSDADVANVHAYLKKKYAL
jgi:hypothetical protein